MMRLRIGLFGFEGASTDLGADCLGTSLMVSFTMGSDGEIFKATFDMIATRFELNGSV